MNKNFGNAVEKMKKVAKNWRYRYLTVFRKICFVKTLMFPNNKHCYNTAKYFQKRIDDIEKICCDINRTIKGQWLALEKVYWLPRKRMILVPSE